MFKSEDVSGNMVQGENVPHTRERRTWSCSSGVDNNTDVLSKLCTLESFARHGHLRGIVTAADTHLERWTWNL